MKRVMKESRSILGVLAVLLVAVTLSSFIPAQPAGLRKFLHRSPETRANIITTIMENQLDLDKQQVEKAYQINLKYAEMIQPYLKDKEVAPKSKEVLINLNQKRVEELKALLTPPQHEKVRKIREEWIERLETILSQLKKNDISNP